MYPALSRTLNFLNSNLNCHLKHKLCNNNPDLPFFSQNVASVSTENMANSFVLSE